MGIQTHQPIREWAKIGENATLEFKSQVPAPHKMARTICAFANSKGGKIIVGLTDDKEIIGVIDVKQEKEKLLLAANQYCTPNIPLTFQTYEENYLTILVAQVNESTNKPHHATNANGVIHAFVRQHDQTVLASKMMEKVLLNEIVEAEETPSRPLDKKEKGLIVYLEKRKTITVKEFMHLMNLSKRRAKRMLTNLVLDGYLFMHDKQKEDYYTLR